MSNPYELDGIVYCVDNQINASPMREKKKLETEQNRIAKKQKFDNKFCMRFDMNLKISANSISSTILSFSKNKRKADDITYN